MMEFKCRYCREYFSSYAKRWVHVNSAHLHCVYVCTACNRKFNSAPPAYQHAVRIHAGQKKIIKRVSRTTNPEVTDFNPADFNPARTDFHHSSPSDYASEVTYYRPPSSTEERELDGHIEGLLDKETDMARAKRARMSEGAGGGGGGSGGGGGGNGYEYGGGSGGDYTTSSPRHSLRRENGAQGASSSSSTTISTIPQNPPLSSTVPPPTPSPSKKSSSSCLQCHLCDEPFYSTWNLNRHLTVVHSVSKHSAHHIYQQRQQLQKLQQQQHQLRSNSSSYPARDNGNNGDAAHNFGGGNDSNNSNSSTVSPIRKTEEDDVIRCQYCHIDCFGPQALENHIRYKHEGVNDPDAPKDLSVRRDSAASLGGRNGSSTGSNDVIELDSNEDDEEGLNHREARALQFKKRYVFVGDRVLCTSCDKYLTYANWHGHEDSIHQNKSFDCQKCGKTLKWRKNRVRHEDICSGKLDEGGVKNEEEEEENHDGGGGGHKISSLSPTNSNNHRSRKNSSFSNPNISDGGGRQNGDDDEDVAVSENGNNKNNNVNGDDDPEMDEEDDEAHEAELAAKAEKMKDYVSVVESGDKKSWVCTDCSAEYNSRGGLVAHVHRRHFNTVFKCRSCAKPFNYLTDLNRHVREGPCSRDSRRGRPSLSRLTEQPRLILVSNNNGTNSTTTLPVASGAGSTFDADYYSTNGYSSSNGFYSSASAYNSSVNRGQLEGAAHSLNDEENWKDSSTVHKDYHVKSLAMEVDAVSNPTSSTVAPLPYSSMGNGVRRGVGSSGMRSTSKDYKPSKSEDGRRTPECCRGGVCTRNLPSTPSTPYTAPKASSTPSYGATPTSSRMSSTQAADAALDAAYIDVVGACKEGTVESIRSVAVEPQNLSMNSPGYGGASVTSSSKDRGTPSPTSSNYQPYNAPYPLPHLQQTTSPQLVDISAAATENEDARIEAQVARPPSVPIKIEVDGEPGLKSQCFFCSVLLPCASEEQKKHLLEHLEEYYCKTVCPQCLTRCSSNKAMTDHFLMVHLKLKKLLCEESDCVRTCWTKAQMERHVKNHSAPPEGVLKDAE